MEPTKCHTCFEYGCEERAERAALCLLTSRNTLYVALECHVMIFFMGSGLDDGWKPLSLKAGCEPEHMHGSLLDHVPHDYCTLET